MYSLIQNGRLDHLIIKIEERLKEEGPQILIFKIKSQGCYQQIIKLVKVKIQIAMIPFLNGPMNKRRLIEIKKINTINIKLSFFMN